MTQSHIWVQCAWLYLKKAVYQTLQAKAEATRRALYCSWILGENASPLKCFNTGVGDVSVYRVFVTFHKVAYRILCLAIGSQLRRANEGSLLNEYKRVLKSSHDSLNFGLTTTDARHTPRASRRDNSLEGCDQSQKLYILLVVFCFYQTTAPCR